MPAWIRNTQFYLLVSFCSEKFMVDTEPNNHFKSLPFLYMNITFSKGKSYFLFTRAPKRRRYYKWFSWKPPKLCMIYQDCASCSNFLMCFADFSLSMLSIIWKRLWYSWFSSLCFSRPIKGKRWWSDGGVVCKDKQNTSALLRSQEILFQTQENGWLCQETQEHCCHCSIKAKAGVITHSHTTICIVL